MTIREILETYRHIAIVGMSDNPERPSSSVSKYMMHAGYTVYPVNPTKERIFGLESYPSIGRMPPNVKQAIEIVDIFRKPEAVGAVVDEAIEAGAKVVWMQLGITDEKAAEKARAAGLEVVQNRCIAVEHRHLSA